MKPNITPTEEWNASYWSYNCPLQMWKEDNGWRVVNYMPRKESICDLDDRVTTDELPQFCANAAAMLRNLADQFDALAAGKIDYIYYHDADIDEAIKEKTEDDDEGDAT